MSLLRSPLFIICLAVFILHQLAQKFLNIHFGLADRYLDNLLAMPVILSLWKAEKTWLFKKDKNYQLSSLEIIMATAHVALITEILFPILSTNFTSDWIDVVFYSTGSLLFYIFQKSKR